MKRLLLSSVCAVLALTNTPAAAQEKRGDTAAADEGEIIVTARKREESILKVPVIATVLNQEALETYQIQDLYAVAQRVPGFVMGESVGTVGIQASLRGIGPTSQTSTVDQSVSLNIDGLQLSQGYAFTAGMFDVARVEVLKGPQALFFGKNSPAGVISLRSADPTNEFELMSRAGYEIEAREMLGELVISGPVAPSLKLRLATRYSAQDGFFKNNGIPLPNRGAVAPKDRRFAPKRGLVMRGTALFDPSSTYKARLKLNYVDDHMEGSGGDGQIAKCPDGRGGVAPTNIPFLYDSDCKIDRFTQLGNFDPRFFPGIRNNGVPFTDSKQVFGTLEQNLRLGDHLDLTSVTGYYKLRQDNLIRGSGVSTPTIGADFRFRNRQFTQELRLTSDFVDSPVNFMVGGFYQNGEINVRGRLRGNTALGLSPLLFAVRHRVEIESASLFGQLIWNLTDQLELSGGARWTREVRKHTQLNDLAGGALVLVPVPRLEASNISPEIALTYKPTDTLTIFGSYRQGFKSGSFNTIQTILPPTRADFNDEKAEGGEVGIKALLLDRRLRVNLAAYHYIYSDLQVGANELTPSGGIALRTINAASAKVQGIEFDATYDPPGIDGLSLNGAVNYNRARYKDFRTAPCANGQTIAEGCDQLFAPGNQLLPPAAGSVVVNGQWGFFTSQDLTGRPLVRAPNWTANLGFNYDMPVGNGLRLGVGSALLYSSKFFTNLTDLPDYIQKGYVKIAANVALKGRDDRWELALIGNNLTNKITTGTCSNGNSQNGTVFGGLRSGGTTKGAAGSDEPYCVPERGREVWLRFTMRIR